jgi:splicing factor 3A subunit 3
LYEFHSQFLNLEGTSRLSYIAYLDMLRQGRVERTLYLKEKARPAYLEYVKGLYTYLAGFFERALPLFDIQKTLAELEAKFEADWAAGSIEGWTDGKATSTAANGGEGIWCPYCAKNYSKQTVYDAHLNSGKHKKKVAAGVQVAQDAAPAAGPSTVGDKHKPAARYTTLVVALLGLDPIPARLADSRAEVERRMALTAREREAELVEVEEAPPPVEVPIHTSRDDDDDEDDDDKVYNPLKLPLGWDGKPIPFWLYKLHGLGVEFKCEICSDYVYMGRKAFDRHFQESRHAFGMRALGLPNTRHFHEITKIADALASELSSGLSGFLVLTLFPVAEKLKREGRQELALMEKAEEFEDADGNVYDKKTYEDLKRQGLL